MGFPWQEYWSRLPIPFPGDLSDPVIEPGSPTFQADSLPSEPPGKPSYMCTVDYYSAIKKNEVLSFATIQVELENIILSEIIT